MRISAAKQMEAILLVAAGTRAAWWKSSTKLTTSRIVRNSRVPFERLIRVEWNWVLANEEEHTSLQKARERKLRKHRRFP